MKLKNFIGKLNEILKKHGGSLEVEMADNIAVVDPVLLKDGKDTVVIITDQN